MRPHLGQSVQRDSLLLGVAVSRRHDMSRVPSGARESTPGVRLRVLMVWTCGCRALSLEEGLPVVFDWLSMTVFRSFVRLFLYYATASEFCAAKKNVSPKELLWLRLLFVVDVEWGWVDEWEKKKMVRK